MVLILMHVDRCEIPKQRLGMGPIYNYIKYCSTSELTSELTSVGNGLQPWTQYCYWCGLVAESSRYSKVLFAETAAVEIPSC